MHLTTTTTAGPETTGPGQPAPPKSRKRRYFAVAGVAAVAGAVGAAWFAGAFGHGPQTATQIVAGDGYTVVQTYTPASMPASLAPYATSAAYGVSGGNAEAVVVFKHADAGLASLAAPILQSELPGLTVTLKGDDLTVTGSESQFAGVGGF